MKWWCVTDISGADYKFQAKSWEVHNNGDLYFLNEAKNVVVAYARGQWKRFVALGDRPRDYVLGVS